MLIKMSSLGIEPAERLEGVRPSCRCPWGQRGVEGEGCRPQTREHTTLIPRSLLLSEHPLRAWPCVRVPAWAVALMSPSTWGELL